MIVLIYLVIMNFYFKIVSNKYIIIMIDINFSYFSRNI